MITMVTPQICVPVIIVASVSMLTPVLLVLFLLEERIKCLFDKNKLRWLQCGGIFMLYCFSMTYSMYNYFLLKMQGTAKNHMFEAEVILRIISMFSYLNSIEHH